MKKSLLSILAGALLVVGCQNYDDQFDSLESQINALASTVAGLSQVQSDLSSLAGTVSSLSSTVASLGTAIDTAVSNGLADITADIAALQAAVADVASSSDVTAISDALAAAQTDLEELLANSSVFTGDVTINSVSTLAAFKAMGSGLAIVNGNVTITVSEEMNQADVQAVVDQMLTITKDLTYTSAKNTIAETVFTNLSGVQSITATQAGGYQFPKLVSATIINLKDDFESTVKVIDFGELTSVTSIGTNGVAGTVEFTKATNFHITKLPRYGASLTVKLDKGSTFLMDALKDVAADGTQSALALSITGPKSMTIANLDGKGGSISLTDVQTAVINDFDGDITIGAGVESFTSNNVVTLAGAMTDIETLDIKGVLDPNATAASPDKSGPAISLSSKTDLETVKLSGDFASIALSSNNNLTSATISAKSSNGIISLASNADLTTVDLTGSSATGVTVDNNDNLETLDIKTTMIAGTAAAAVVNGAIVVTNNDDLTSLTIGSSNLKTLTVTNNSDLATIDGSAIKAAGATAGINVAVWGNALTASVAKELTAATATANSTGNFTTSSGMGTLAAFLALAAADTKATANVYFDTINSTTDSKSVETAGTSTGSVTANIVLKVTPGTADVTTGNNALVKEKRAWQIPATSGIGINLTIDAIEVLHDGSAYGTVTTTGNLDIDLVALKSALAVSRATTLGTTLDVRKEGNPAMPSVVFRSTVTSATGGNGENYTNTQAAAIGAGTNNAFVTSWDNFTITIDGLSATASISTASASAASASHAIASQLAQAWAAKYNTDGTASGSMSLWTADGDSTSGTIAISLKASTSGSRGFGDLVSIAWSKKATAAQISTATAGVVTLTSALVADWIIGATEATTDNAATAQALVMTLAEDTNLVTTGSQATVTFAGAAGGIELATTNVLYNNGGAGTDTTTTADIHPLDARGDVVKRESANEGTTVAGTDRVKIDRSTWTFGA